MHHVYKDCKMLTRRRAKQPEISLITGGDTLREVKTAVTTSVKTGRHQEVVVGQSLGAGSLVRVAIGKKNYCGEPFQQSTIVLMCGVTRVGGVLADVLISKLKKVSFAADIKIIIIIRASGAIFVGTHIGGFHSLPLLRVSL